MLLFFKVSFFLIACCELCKQNNFIERLWVRSRLRGTLLIRSGERRSPQEKSEVKFLVGFKKKNCNLIDEEKSTASAFCSINYPRVCIFFSVITCSFSSIYLFA